MKLQKIFAGALLGGAAGLFIGAEAGHKLPTQTNFRRGAGVANIAVANTVNRLETDILLILSPLGGAALGATAIAYTELSSELEPRQVDRQQAS
ncbi:MAG TPA: hypothetical protein VLF90_02765 [Patescibacteria group bacterium]|nr:hypothetical protein [Patescibacteria group bacterium]